MHRYVCVVDNVAKLASAHATAALISFSKYTIFTGNFIPLHHARPHTPSIFVSSCFWIFPPPPPQANASNLFLSFRFFSRSFLLLSCIWWAALSWLTWLQRLKNRSERKKRSMEIYGPDKNEKARLISSPLQSHGRVRDRRDEWVSGERAN